MKDSRDSIVFPHLRHWNFLTPISVSIGRRIIFDRNRFVSPNNLFSSSIKRNRVSKFQFFSTAVSYVYVQCSTSQAVSFFSRQRLSLDELASSIGQQHCIGSLTYMAIIDMIRDGSSHLGSKPTIGAHVRPVDRWIVSIHMPLMVALPVCLIIALSAIINLF